MAAGGDGGEPPAVASRFTPTRASDVADLETPLLENRHYYEEEASQIQPGTASVLQSVFNVVNLYMGVGLLSLPYAVKLGGWLSLPALVLAVALFAYSAHLIVDGFKKVEGRSQSYAALGETAFGLLGRRAVALCTLLDMFGLCCICLIMSCKQVEAIILLLGVKVSGFAAPQLAQLLGLAVAAPTVLISSFSQLAPVSLLGICCSLLVTAAVLLSAASDPHREYVAVWPSQEPSGHRVFATSLVRSIGIFAISMAGHSALPSFRSSMSRPNLFHSVITIAFAIMLVFNVGVAYVGYWYWGEDVSEIVMRDIALKSPLAGLLGVGTAMTALIAVNSFSKVPTLLLVLQDLLTATVEPPKSISPSTLGLALRTVSFFCVSFVAVVGYDVLGAVMSLMGGLTSMNASVVFPLLFYLKLFWQEISLAKRLSVAVLLCISIALSVTIVEESLRSLIHSFSATAPPATPPADRLGLGSSTSAGEVWESGICELWANHWGGQVLECMGGSAYEGSLAHLLSSARDK